MNRIAFAVGFTALSTLLLELTLIRIFDVLWFPNMAYMVITLAMFSFGLSGVYVSIKPKFVKIKMETVLFVAAILLGVFSVAILPILNAFPFDYKQIGTDKTDVMLFRFFLIYLSIGIPFFLGGMILSWIFTTFSQKIQKLYFWDLSGAAIGCLVLVPLIPKLGAGGILFVVCGLSFMAASFFTPQPKLRIPVLLLAIVIAAIPFLKTKPFEFTPHMNKRFFRALTKDKELHEASYWDPISKIDIIRYPNHPRIKWIAYDGGTQTSYFYEFDGDFNALRKELPQNARNHFWGNIVLPSHFLKADANQEVLIIGNAGGQEAKAALTYGAKHVDGIELVGKVVELGKSDYSKFTGNIFNHPKVNIQKGEGRSFLRSINKKYDIIQIMSNHTSSSIAAGSGAMSATYLQTVEAYQEYFAHLKDDGILHINHHIYPRMVATAAKAWKAMGKDNFQAHVVVFEIPGAMDNLPTFLVKMAPWKKDEVDRLINFMGGIPIVVNPFNQKNSFLSEAFFAGDLSEDIKKNADFFIYGPTDNQPFFNHLRKKLGKIVENPAIFQNKSTADLLTIPACRVTFPWILFIW